MKKKICQLSTYIIFLFLLMINLFPNINIKNNKNRMIDVVIDNNKYSLELGSTIKDLKNKDNISNNNRSVIADDYILSNNEIISTESNNETEYVSINIADIDELIKLPGIGIKIAEKIIQYREKYNGFKYIEEIKEVSGIGVKKYERIKNLISL